MFLFYQSPRFKSCIERADNHYNNIPNHHLIINNQILFAYANTHTTIILVNQVHLNKRNSMMKSIWFLIF